MYRAAGRVEWQLSTWFIHSRCSDTQPSQVRQVKVRAFDSADWNR